MNPLSAALLISLTGAIIAPPFAYGAPTAGAVALQSVDKSRYLCAEATEQQARKNHIPRHLLTAISRAESGRWDSKTGENFAWPWTVTALGKGQFFPSKAEAITRVLSLRADGVRNIDVGCMQVNLKYHDKAFASLAEAFDPGDNAAYAAQFLLQNHAITGSWPGAAARYHSTTPERNRPYRRKVMKIWRQVQREAALRPQSTARLSNPAPLAAPLAAQPPVTTQAKHSRKAPGSRIDKARTAFLNNRLKSRRAAERRIMASGFTQAEKKTARRLSQLSAWRDARVNNMPASHLAARTRAETAIRQKQRLMKIFSGNKAAKFAARRKKQLQRWRNNGAGIIQFNGSS